jgi:capsular polysaccharide biosynthesis protein
MLTYAIDSRPVAEEAIRRLGLQMEPAELLEILTVEQVENTSFIVLSYKGTDPVQAKQIANTVGKVSSELISERSAAGSKLRATVYEDAIVPTTPVSPTPLRNGLLALIVGLAISAGLLSGRLEAVAVPVGLLRRWVNSNCLLCQVGSSSFANSFAPSWTPSGAFGCS